MNKEFCISCGAKSLFEISKPKYCPSCGEHFNTSLSSSPKKRREEKDYDNDDDEEYSPRSFDIQKLKDSIVAENEKNKKTLDDLWKNPAPKDPNLYRTPSSDPSGKELLKQTMAECASVKVSTDINE